MVTLSCKAVLKVDNLRRLVELNRVRLGEAYHLLTQGFKDSGISYFPANCTTFLLADLAPKAKSKEEEVAAFLKYSEAGVLLAAGSVYHLPANYHGWFRVCFAVDPGVLKLAMATIIEVYQKLS